MQLIIAAAVLAIALHNFPIRFCYIAAYEPTSTSRYPNRIASNSKQLHIGGVFPMEAGSGGWPGGQACLPAVQMAFEDINRNRRVLPGYSLHLHHYNSKCLPGLASKQMFELLYNEPTKVMLLAGCSPVTTLVAESAHVWNMIVLSYGASSPALSNRQRFPTLFRTHPSANMQNPTRVHLFERFNWRRVTILQSVEEVFTSTAKDLEKLCRARGIRVERQTFFGDPADAVRTLARHDVRIIVGLFYVTEARRVLCQAYHQRLYGRKHLWFFIGWYADTWYVPPRDEHLNCTREQMAEAAQYHFTTESIMLSRDSMPGVSGMTGREFQRRLKRRLHTEPADTGGWPEAPLAYDAAWALALALNCTQNSLSGHEVQEGGEAEETVGLRLEDFNYEDTVLADRMFECVKNTQFKGVSGQMMFSDEGDRMARTQIEQMQDGKYVVLGFYDTTTQTLEWFNRERFHSAKGLPPPDSTIVQPWLVTIDGRLYALVAFLVVVGLSMAVVALYANRHYAHRRLIAQSQPICNDLLVAGSAIALLSLLLIGLPVGGMALPREEARFSLFCHLRLSLLSLGFSLGFGSLFAKVWIVHWLAAADKRQEIEELAKLQAQEQAMQDGACSDTSAPWESIRMLLGAMVGRQALVAVALRKVSTTQSTQLTQQSALYAGGSRRTAMVNAAPVLKPSPLSQPIPVSRFYMVVGSLCAADAILLFAWLLVDPLKRVEQRFHLQEPTSTDEDEDVMLLPILELCQSEHHDVWTALALGSKALLLLFSLFFTFESRHVKAQHVNDTRLVHLATCNVAMLSLITGPIAAYFLRPQATPFFAFVSATIVLCAYISMGLVFIPKLLYIRRVPTHMDSQSKESNQSSNLQPPTSGAQLAANPSTSSMQGRPLSAAGTTSPVRRAELLRYQQLANQNVDLKRQIEIRKVKIKQCHLLLEKRLGSSPRIKFRRRANTAGNSDNKSPLPPLKANRGKATAASSGSLGTASGSLRQYQEASSGGGGEHEEHAPSGSSPHATVFTNYYAATKTGYVDFDRGRWGQHAHAEPSSSAYYSNAMPATLSSSSAEELEGQPPGASATFTTTAVVECHYVNHHGGSEEDEEEKEEKRDRVAAGRGADTGIDSDYDEEVLIMSGGLALDLAATMNADENSAMADQMSRSTNPKWISSSRRVDGTLPSPTWRLMESVGDHDSSLFPPTSKHPFLKGVGKEPYAEVAASCYTCTQASIATTIATANRDDGASCEKKKVLAMKIAEDLIVESDGSSSPTPDSDLSDEGEEIFL